MCATKLEADTGRRTGGQVVGAHDVRGAQDLLADGGHHAVREARDYLQGQGCLHDSKLAGQKAVHLHDGVVAEQGGCDAQGGHQRRGDLVGREDVLVRARLVGQQRARDGALAVR